MVICEDKQAKPEHGMVRLNHALIDAISGGRQTQTQLRAGDEVTYRSDI